MTLRRDTNAGENLTALLVILGCVFVVGSFVIAMMSPIFSSGTDAQTGVDPLSTFGDTSIGAYWDPSLGYAVTWANATDDPIRSGAAKEFEFTTTITTGTVYVDTVRNNTYFPDTEWWEQYYDFIGCQYGLTFCMPVTYSAIENATTYFVDGRVFSIMYPGWPMNETTALIVEFEDDATPAEVNTALWADNTFTLYIAWITSVSEDGELAWYNIAWQIASFQYEITGTAFDNIFSAIIDMIIVTATIVIFSRVFHGG